MVRLRSVHPAVLLAGFQKSFLTWTLGLLPKSHSQVDELEFGWDEYEEHIQKWYYFFSIVLILAVIAIFAALDTLPVLQISILRIYVEGGQFLLQTLFHITADYRSVLTLSAFIFLILNRDTIGSIVGASADGLADKLPAFAMREELIFRTGSEKWSWSQRIRASLSFGLAHFSMLLVPFSATIALAFAGFIMGIIYLNAYRQSQSQEVATFKSATLHTAYNYTVLWSFVIFTFGALGVAVVTLLIDLL